MNAVEVQGLSFAYKGSEREAISGVDLAISPGEFVVLMGPSGAGKSTFCLTLNGLIPNFKKGKYSGEVRVFGVPTKKHKVSDLARDIVLVFQDFETQIFSTNVELEVAFGPENFGVDPDEIGRRIHATLKRVRLDGFEARQPATLSGGQKQRLAIASALSIQPRIICMDEPTTDLDPIGKFDVFQVADELSREKNMTMLIVEHETEEALKADRIVLMRDGRIVAEGKARAILASPALLEECSVKPLEVAEFFASLGPGASLDGGELPLTVEEGLSAWERLGLAADRRRLDSLVSEKTRQQQAGYGDPVIEVRNLVHRYENGLEALRGVDLTIRRGEFVAVLGQNGSGKTTLVKHFNGLLAPTGGEVVVNARDTRATSMFELSKTVGYVFQNPDHQIFAQTVFDEVAYGPRLFGVPEGEVKARVVDALEAVGLTGSEEEDPFSLTKGQRQRVAVASVLAAKPEVIILDEPTTGLDYKEQESMMDLTKRLNEMGHTIIIVTHSMWVTAAYAHRAVVLKEGQVVMHGPVRDVFVREKELADVFLKPPQIVRFGARLGLPVLTVDELVACVGREEGARK